MFHIQGKIRDYKPLTDTATVEFEGIGVIDTWMDGLVVDPSLNRAFLVHGAPVTLQAPDANRLCEAIIVGSGAPVTQPVINTGAAAQNVQTGRVIVPTDGTGHGSAAVSFSPGYLSAPSIYIGGDDAAHPTLSAVTGAGFTVTVSGFLLNSYAQFSWQAVGH